jgi:uncharacterized protein YceH (UPF0502 family)
MHLLSGDVEGPSMAGAPSSARANPGEENDEITRLEGELQELRKEVADLKQQFEAFRKVLE